MLRGRAGPRWAELLGFSLDNKIKQTHKTRTQNKTHHQARFFRNLRLRIGFPAGADLVLLSHVTQHEGVGCFRVQVAMNLCDCFASVPLCLSATLQDSRRQAQ